MNLGGVRLCSLNSGRIHPLCTFNWPKSPHLLRLKECIILYWEKNQNQVVLYVHYKKSFKIKKTSTTTLFCYSNQVLTKEFWSSTKLADVLNLRQKCANNVISALCEQVYSVDIYYFSTPGAQKTISFNKWGYVLWTI